MATLSTNTAAMADFGSVQADTESGSRSKFAYWLMIGFVLSLLIPVHIPVGPVLLMPHRLLLMISFFPSLMWLFTGRAGRVLWADWLMIAATVWALLSVLITARSGQSTLEPLGIFTLEFLGAYLLSRTAIRSTSDFMAFAKLFFVSVLFLVPFAAIESFTYRPVLLDLIPKSVAPVYTHHRWGMRRAQTIFAHPILFGVYASIGFGLFWFVLRSTMTRLTAAVAVVMATIFSLSTGALMSVVFQTIFIGWEVILKSLRKRWSLFAGLFAVIYILIDLLSNRTPFHVLITYATFNTGSAYNRILIWNFGTENVMENPWFGLGVNVHEWARPSWMSSSADNFWLLMAMQYGVPCFIFLATALYLIIRAIGKAPLVSAQDLRCRAGYLVPIGGIILAGGTVHYWHAMMAFVMFFIGSGVWMINGNTEADPDADVSADKSEAQAQTSTHNSPYARHTTLHVRGQTPSDKKKSSDRAGSVHTKRLVGSVYKREKAAPVVKSEAPKPSRVSEMPTSRRTQPPYKRSGDH